MPGELVPIIAMMIPIMALAIPIVAILAAHQRKMTETFRAGSTPDPMMHQVLAELQAMRSQVNVLTDRVNQVAISADTQPSLSYSPPPTPIQAGGNPTSDI